MSLAPLPDTLIPFMQSYIPPRDYQGQRPFVTLTYAQSLDSKIAACPGIQTKISGPQTKTMTHYIRSLHDAILVGVGTVRADDPKLNCRYSDGNSDGNRNPRPVILDPKGSWDYSNSQLRRICDLKQGLAPYIIVDDSVIESMIQSSSETLQKQGGKYIGISIFNRTSEQVWEQVFHALHSVGIQSVMVEGGASVINQLVMLPQLVDSVIITIGSVFLGPEGVAVEPGAAKLHNVAWWSHETDAVVCGTTTPN